MTPEEYDGWYDTPRGRWIGEAEYRLILQQLRYRSGEKILDVGCGTGWFTRRIATLPLVDVTGLDLDHESLTFAQQKDPESTYVLGDARRLPFEDNSFDRVFSNAALCFVDDWPLAIREIVRVTRRRFAIGLLNRHGLLWRTKGQGQGAYRGARWHERREVLDVLDGLPVTNIRVRTAIWFPGGTLPARMTERILPACLPFGSFLLVAADKSMDGG